jgi:hypothetical protein
VPPVDGLLGRRQDRVAVLHHLVRRQAAVRVPEVHGAAAGVEAQADLLRGADRRPQQVARARREEVVVVGGRRAPGARERAQGGQGGGVGRLLVQQGPARVEGPQPPEQALLLGQPARGPLGEVVVAVDEARCREVAAAVDPPRPRGLGRGAAAEGRDAPVLHQDPALVVLGAGVVHGGDGAALQQQRVAHRAVRADASRTASRIFS